MKVSWKQFAHIGVAMLGVINPAIPAAELAIEGVLKSGADKKHKALEAALLAAEAADTVFGKDVVQSEKVRARIAQINDLIVKLHEDVAEAAIAAKAPG